MCACTTHIACMATKTISLKVEAYDRLTAARRYPTESFSEVVLRASWPEDTVTAGAFLRHVQSEEGMFSGEELVRIEAVTQADAPPVDKWAAH